MAKKPANTVADMVRRAYGPKSDVARRDQVATDFRLELSASEKKRLAAERKEARSRLLAAG